MSSITQFETLESRLIELRGTLVLIDRDVAELFGVETKAVNKAVKNKPAKFLEGYVFEATKEEFDVVRRKFSTANFSKSRVMPKAFTEKGLYSYAFAEQGLV